MFQTPLEPVTLHGRAVTLAPLSLDHLGELERVALDPELWRWVPTQVRTRDDLRAYVEDALDERRRGVSLPFALQDATTGRAAGSTRYANVSSRDRRVEIGWTWVGREWQRTALNTEAKYLLLCHAFETLGCVRVELKTDALNTRSRAAIRRIGAVEEGTLRRHRLTDTGRMRDTVYFSILDDEWPAVKAGLERKLMR